MIDQKDKIEMYAKDASLGFKSVADIQKITDYYNTLKE
jgi:hypothetical protein